MKVYSVITRRASAERVEWLNRQLSARGLTAEPMLQGDIDDLDEAMLDRCFAGDMHRPAPATSCAAKHLLIARAMCDAPDDWAMVVEDDVMFKRNFDRIFPQILAEIQAFDPEQPILLSLEDTRLRFVPRSRRRAARYVYDAPHDRFTACYLLNRAAARAITRTLETVKCDVPIDIFHTKLARMGVLRYMWAEPPVASQASQRGKLQSTINDPAGRLKTLKWYFKYHYRRLLYFFR